MSKKKQTRSQVKSDFIGKEHCSGGGVGILQSGAGPDLSIYEDLKGQTEQIFLLQGRSVSTASTYVALAPVGASSYGQLPRLSSVVSRFLGRLLGECF